MSGPESSSDEPVSYALRLHERAFRDINCAFVRLADVVSETAARNWREGLTDAMAGLATFPRRNPLATERFRREVRQLLYQRTGSQIAYRILFTIIGDQGQSPDPPTAIILQMRHASARPLTKAQIPAIESDV